LHRNPEAGKFLGFLFFFAHKQAFHQPMASDLITTILGNKEEIGKINRAISSYKDIQKQSRIVHGIVSLDDKEAEKFFKLLGLVTGFDNIVFIKVVHQYFTAKRLNKVLRDEFDVQDESLATDLSMIVFENAKTKFLEDSKNLDFFMKQLQECIPFVIKIIQAPQEELTAADLLRFINILLVDEDEGTDVLKDLADSDGDDSSSDDDNDVPDLIRDI
jgi:hypothetical protein